MGEDTAMNNETTDAAAAAPLLKPRIEVMETESGYRIVADMPGVSLNNVELVLSGDRIELNGEAQDDSVPGYRMTHREYHPGTFSRTLSLPDDIDREQVRAELKNGLLTINLPRSKAARPRSIKIEATDGGQDNGD